MVARIRLYSGMVLLVFVTGHLFNASMGLISFEAMDVSSQFTTRPWRSLPGTILLVGAFLTHTALSLRSLFFRQTLRMKPWEATQNILGLLIPLLLFGHVAATRGLVEIMGLKTGYALEMLALFVVSPEFGVIQVALVVLVWIHGCIGIHTWARLKARYQRHQGWALALAVGWPVMALSGYVASGIRAQEMAADQAWVGAIVKESGFTNDMLTAAMAWMTNLCIGYLILIALLFGARWIRLAIAKRETPLVLHYQGGQEITAIPGATVLESLRAGGIPHASVCGGRGRCSTCRVRVGRGADWLTPPDENEVKVLERISAPPSVRLACQIRPKVDLEIAPLLSPEATASDGFEQPGYLAGQEVEVAFVFVDLRGSTGLSEGRLPYDFVFVLNQFFAAIDGALQETNGHYAQFNGDGLMAIYGLNSGIQQGAREAIEGAKVMMRRIAELNERLKAELPTPLAIGIGIHSGEAIVGSMGPPDHPIISAIGDHVNIAARLEAKCKDFGVPLIVSAITAEKAGIDLGGFQSETVDVRGRDGNVRIWIIDDPAEIDLATAKETVPA